MIHLIRRYQRQLMLLVAILTIVAFVWLYNDTNLQKVGVNDVARVYGRTLVDADVERFAKLYRLAFQLGFTDLLVTLGGDLQEQAFVDFGFNLLILQHEARRLGIEPTNQQVLQALEKIPVFQRDGQFDRDLYTQFLGERLGPLGLTQREIEELARDTLRLERLRAILESQTAVSPSELTFALRTLQPVTAEAAIFRVDNFLQTATVSADAVQRFFDENSAHMVTQEYRRVSYVVFELPPEQASLTGKEKIEALQAKADEASNFADEAAGKGIAPTAKEKGLTVRQSADFDRDGMPRQTGEMASGDVLREEARIFARDTYGKPAEDKSPQIAQQGDRFYVFATEEVTPSRPLTFEEARPRIEQELRREAAMRNMRAAAELALRSTLEAVQQGRSFSEAAKASGAEIVQLDKVSPNEATGDQQRQAIAGATLFLQPGAIGGLNDTPWGTFFARLDARESLPQDMRTSQEEMVRTAMEGNKQQLLFIEWLRNAREKADITPLRGAAAL